MKCSKELVYFHRKLYMQIPCPICNNQCDFHTYMGCKICEIYFIANTFPNIGPVYYIWNITPPSGSCEYKSVVVINIARYISLLVIGNKEYENMKFPTDWHPHKLINNANLQVSSLNENSNENILFLLKSIDILS